MNFCSSRWTIVLWLFPRNSSQMLAPDNTIVVTAGKEEFPFFPEVMDFLSRSSSLLSTQAHNLPLEREMWERVAFWGLRTNRKALVRLQIHTAHNARRLLMLPCSPVWAPLKAPCPEPQNWFPKPSQGQTRRSALSGDALDLLLCKPSPDNQGADSLPQTGWVFFPDWYFKNGLEYKYRKKKSPHITRELFAETNYLNISQV